MTGKWFIRLAQPADAQELTQLVNQAYRGEGGWTTEQHLVGGQRATLAQVTEWLEDQTRQGRQSKQPIFVAVGDSGSFMPVIGDSARDENGVTLAPDLQARHHDLLLGCIQPSSLDTPLSIGAEGVSLQTGDDEQKEAPETPRKAKLELFAVSPAYQSHGIGKALLNYALDHMRSTWHTSICVISVIEVRQDIIKWYEKQGFTWDGVTTKPFCSPELAKSEFKFRVMEKII